LTAAQLRRAQFGTIHLHYSFRPDLDLAIDASRGRLSLFLGARERYQAPWGKSGASLVILAQLDDLNAKSATGSRCELTTNSIAD
jgi:hypothetical protein